MRVKMLLQTAAHSSLLPRCFAAENDDTSSCSTSFIRDLGRPSALGIRPRCARRGFLTSQQRYRARACETKYRGKELRSATGAVRERTTNRNGSLVVSGDRNLAIFCDFENIALGARDAKYARFDMQPVLQKLLLK